MAKNSNYTMQHRRRREGRTNYDRRLKLLVSRKARLVVRRTLKGMSAQIVQYTPDGDKVIFAAKSSELKKYGLPVVNGNIPVAYLTGLLLAQKAKSFSGELIVDYGVRYLTAQSRLFALTKGAIDGGLQIISGDDFFPEDDLCAGKNIESFAESIKENTQLYQKQFSAYIKQNIDPVAISKTYEKVRESIQK
ncbi:MAG: 50S ribosomal protein L18 [Candidatus Woesearchaeota archaeon]